MMRICAAWPALALAHNHLIGESGVFKLEDWTTRELPGFTHPDGYLVNRTYYKSPEIKLKTGDAHFTLNQFTAMPFPKGNYALLRADWDLVDGSDRKVGLHEVYNHHWLVGAKNGMDPLMPCEMDLFFGAGAEMRHMPSVSPKGYGNRRIYASGHCGANLHFIRTEGLATKWHGMNDPSQFPKDMQYGAAVKNCIECGYAPGRALGVCFPFNDGEFNCCFTGSRCPVVDHFDRSTKSYHLTYEVQWTQNLTAVKPMQGGCIDLSNSLIEWNVAPKLTNRRANQVCTETVCNISQTYSVGKLPPFGSYMLTICSGTMLFSYMHQHNGAINGSMHVNGKHHCTSVPKRGTDPNFTVGNEMGYVVGFDACVEDEKNNRLRLEKGDEVRLEALYDVDVNSKLNFPMPGGKHGGIMALFFYFMDCDEDTYHTKWVCWDNQCIESGSAKGDYHTFAECSASCGSTVV